MNKQALLERVSAEQLMEYTQTIASEVRLSGSEEEMRAFRFAESTLQKLGLETHLYTRPAYISLPKSSSLTVNDQLIPSITHAMSKSTGEEGIHAEVVAVGDEEYTEDVTGKVVLVDGLATPGAVQRAHAHGAVAAIFINAEFTHEMIVSTVWGNPSIHQVDHYPQLVVASVSYTDGQQIKALLQQKTSVNVNLVTEVLIEWRDIPTLIADLRLNKETKDFVLFSGHIDSWHLGVMDNGTANATMLECARVLVTEKPELEHNIRFAFWSGHSHGRYAGSALYADENFEELYDHALLHLNIDSVGAKTSTVLTEGNTMAETKDLVARSVDLYSQEAYEGSRFGRAGDQSFWGIGIPSALMGLSEQQPVDTPAMRAFSKLFGDGKGGGFGWWWHTTEDTLDKIDPELLKRDCEIYLSILLDFCTSKCVPVQQGAAIQEIKSVLKAYQNEAGFDTIFEPVLMKLTDLEKCVQEVEHHPNKEQFSSLYNQWNKELSRTLVPINYVKNDRFEHDPALAQPAVPAIAHILRANQTNQHVLYTSLVRQLNKINLTIKKLNEYTERVHHQLNGE